jgi:hypothetical protein
MANYQAMQEVQQDTGLFDSFAGACTTSQLGCCVVCRQKLKLFAILFLVYSTVYAGAAVVGHAIWLAA